MESPTVASGTKALAIEQAYRSEWAKMRNIISVERRLLKRSIIVGLCLSLASTGVCCRASVSVVAPLKSGQNTRIALLASGKPRTGVKVDVYRYELGAGQDDKPRLSLISDEDGWIRLRKLHPGHYHLVASADENLSADLYLEVSADSDKLSSAFLMELRPLVPSPKQLWTNVEQMAVKETVNEFRGVVQDPSGAMVPGTSIEVVRRGTEGKVRVARLKTDKNGRFHKKLHDGVYVAIFVMPGFQISYVPFAVTKQGPGEIKVVLKVAQST